MFVLFLDEEDLHQPSARTHRSRTISTRDDNEINRSRKRHYGSRLSGRSISLSDDASSTNHDHNRGSSPSTSHDPNSILTVSPPKWIPDHAAPRCMSCESQFTAFRRRHRMYLRALFAYEINWLFSFIFRLPLLRTSILWCMLSHNYTTAPFWPHKTRKSLSWVLYS